jgi:hypothetical protein
VQVGVDLPLNCLLLLPSATVQQMNLHIKLFKNMKPFMLE